MSEEKNPGIDSHLLRRIIKFLVPYKKWVIVASTSVIVAAFLGPLIPKLIQVTIDRDVASGDLVGLRNMIGILFVILLAEGALSFVNTYLTQWIGQQAIYDLRIRLYRHIQSQSLRFFDSTPIGRLITRVTSDVESLSDVLSAGLVTILGDLFKIIFISYFMFTLDWRLALVALSVLPFMMWATFWFKNRVRLAYRDTRQQVARLNSFLQEHISGMKIVQIYGREPEEKNRFEAINDDHRQAQIKTVFYFALFFPLADLVASIALGLVIWVGGLNAIGGTLTLGVLIAFIQYVRQFFEPIRNLSDQFNTLQSAMAGAERIFGLLDSDESIVQVAHPIPLSTVKGRIEFKNVWFSYDQSVDPSNDDANWILKDVSFVVEPGQSLAIVGATGAGKTTIISLLLRFYDVQRGEIWLDGVPIHQTSLVELRSHIGLVLQDVFLFSGSVKENITLRNPEISDQVMKDASLAIGAAGFIERLPGGFDYQVKERGISLSHGQRQLLSFVRTLVYDPTILVLDEATSSVDTETEEVIQHAMETLMAGRTTVAIAHRLSTVQHADQILVMHKGQVRERGSHQQLIAADGLYRKLYELQYRDQELLA